MDIKSVKNTLNLDYLRRFGVEIEVNSFDMLNRPVGYEDGKLPEGIHYIGNLVQKTTSEKVLIHKWGNDHHNDVWIVKPDASCGMEICTPVLKGLNGINRTCKVVEALGQDSKISSDGRCSFHVHIDVSDLSDQQLASVITWWVKCEAVFMDSVPLARKKNQYCQFIGLTDIFEHVEDRFLAPEYLFKRIGHCKYYSINTFHFMKKNRKTIEFRIMDNICCLNADMAKNWIKLVLHFVERAIHYGMPLEYIPNNRWSGYCWLDPIDVFEFLGFGVDQYDLSPDAQKVRDWFLSRLKSNVKNSSLIGILSDKGRKIAQEQIKQLDGKFSLPFALEF